jgi:hypothetical protein
MFKSIWNWLFENDRKQESCECECCKSIDFWEDFKVCDNCKIRMDEYERLKNQPVQISTPSQPNNQRLELLAQDDIVTTPVDIPAGIDLNQTPSDVNQTPDKTPLGLGDTPDTNNRHEEGTLFQYDPKKKKDLKLTVEYPDESENIKVFVCLCKCTESVSDSTNEISIDNEFEDDTVEKNLEGEDISDIVPVYTPTPQRYNLRKRRTMDNDVTSPRKSPKTNL